MSARLRTLLLGVAAAVGLLFLFQKSQPLDHEEHLGLVRALRGIQEAQAEVVREALSANLEEEGADARLFAAIDALERSLAFFELAGAAPASEPGKALATLRATARRARERCEELAVRRALLRRELALLPGRVEELGKRALSQPEARAVGRSSGVLLAELARGPADGVDPDQLFRRAEELERAAPELGDQAGPAMLAFAGHVRELATHAAHVRGVLRALRALPLIEHSQSLQDAYDRALEARMRETEGYRVGLYLVSLVLLLELMHYISRQRRTAEELRRSQATLEERVEERTRQLREANLDLQAQIAERRRAEEEAERAREVAEAASRAKSHFLGNMSHEIRTPMTAILGFSERLLDPDLPGDERLEAITTLQRNAAKLLRIIDDILDLARLEDGRLEVNETAFAPGAVVEELREACELRAEIKGLAFEVSGCDTLPPAVVGDAERVRQVLRHLAANAIKFTEAGRVTLDVSCELEDEGRLARLSFDLCDTGIGMAAHEIQGLLAPFTQADESTTRRFGGTGLGLALARRVAERLGGSLEATSEPGRGSRFVFRLPCAVAEGPAAPSKAARGARRVTDGAARPKALAGARLLLAEDGRDNQRLISFVLEKAGAEVAVAGDGQQACDQALAALHEGRPFDVVLMDMQMPVLDGYQATARLRESGYLRPIVALTANASSYDRARCLEAGCDEFCTKPIQRATLVGTIRAFAGLGEDGAEPEEPAAEPARKGARKTARKATRKAAREDPSSTGKSPGAGAKSRGRKAAAKKTTPKTTPQAEEEAADPEFAALVALFVGDLHEDVERMEGALSGGDLEALATSAHQLKGSAGSYGFPELSELAAELEARVRDAAEEDDVREALGVLAGAIAAVQAERATP